MKEKWARMEKIKYDSVHPPLCNKNHNRQLQLIPAVTEMALSSEATLFNFFLVLNLNSTSSDL